MGCAGSRGKGMGATEEAICKIEDKIGFRKISISKFDLEVRRTSRNHMLSMSQFMYLAQNLKLNVGSLTIPEKTNPTALDNNIREYLNGMRCQVEVNGE
jgi:hypothetical protein